MTISERRIAGQRGRDGARVELEEPHLPRHITTMNSELAQANVAAGRGDTTGTRYTYTLQHV